MTDQPRDQHSDELRRRLRAADPASSLPPADPAGVARLLEDVMSTELTTENRATGTRQRGPLTWLVAAAAVLIIAGVGIFAIVGHDDDPAAPPTAARNQTVTTLNAPSDAAYSGIARPCASSPSTVRVDSSISQITRGSSLSRIDPTGPPRPHQIPTLDRDRRRDGVEATRGDSETGSLSGRSGARP